MSSVVISGDTSGAVTLSAPAVAGTVTVTLPSTSGVMAVGGGTITTLTTTSDITVQGVTVGRGAGAVSTNTAVGASALGAANTGAGYVTGIGYQALKSNTSGEYNSAVGGLALYTNTSGSNNSAYGFAALYSNTSGAANVSVGRESLNQNTTASNNTAVGYQSLYSHTGGGNTNNTAVGRISLYSNTSGVQNTAVGNGALYTNIAANNNSAFGESALYYNTTGAKNTAMGQGALQANTTASNNTAVGYQALYTQTNPAGTNTAFGYQAGYGVTTGYDNLLLGDGAGYVGTALTTGTGNICIGTSTRTSAATSTNQINIGYGLTGQADANVTLGSFSGKIYNAYTVNATWTQTSDERLKANIQNDTLGLSFINRLRPVKFNWKASNEIDQGLPYYNETNQRDTETVIHGLIAQEVKAALDAEGVDTFAGWDMGADGIQAISREMFISPLIKAIQELKAELDTAKAQIAALQGA